MRHGIPWVILRALFCALLGVAAEWALAVTPQIAAGVGSTAMLKADGSIWGVGSVPNSGFGALQPTRLFPDFTDGTSISLAGAAYVLRTNGELWGVGLNNTGQLGDGTSDYRGAPVLVLDQVKQVDAQDSWAIALRKDGTVWAWGFNDSAQLGDVSRKTGLRPVQIAGLGNIVAVGAGSSHGVALAADGSVYGWGINAMIPTGDTNYYQYGDPRGILAPTKMKGLPAIAAIRTGRYNTLFLDKTGQLYSYGGEFNGQLGDGKISGPEDGLPVKVALSATVIAFSSCEHDLAITADGQLWAWGRNQSGQLGMPPAGIVSTPTAVKLPAKAVAVAAGWTHSTVLLADGSVMTFGDNTNAQLGHGLFVATSTPTAIVGENGTGSFNVNTTATSPGNAPGVSTNYPASPADYNIRGNAPFTIVLEANANTAAGRTITRYDWISSDGQVATGQRATLTFKRPGTVDVYAVVTDSAGLRSADHRFVTTLPPEGEVAVTPQVSVTADAVTALTDKGVLYGWGDPHYVGRSAGTAYGRGVSLPLDSSLRGMSKVVASAYNSMALTQAGDVLIWGQNCNGSLGTGSTIGWMDDPLRVPLALAAIDIAAGDSCHNAAVLNDGSVWAWGGNEYGQLGHPDTAARSLPARISGLTGIVRVYLAQRGGYAVDGTGQVWAWGDNSNYQLGQGDTQIRRGVVRLSGLPPIRKIAAGYGFALAIANDGGVFGWGGGAGSLGDMSLASPAVKPVKVEALSGFIDFASSLYTLGAKADGSVWVWGSNWGSNMPGSSNDYEPAPIRVQGLANPVSMAVSPYGAAVALKDGHVATWGLNMFGQIGDGTFARRSLPTLVSNPTATGYLTLTSTAPTENAELGYTYFINALLQSSSGLNSFSTKLTDHRARSFDGEIYFTALLPRSSPLVRLMRRDHRDSGTGMVTLTFGRGGFKQTGPTTAAEANVTGTITTDSQYTVYEKSAADPLANSNAIICMGVTLPMLSAKGQVLMRTIATGDQVKSAVQCPTVQTAATTLIYTAQTSGPITSRTITATINPLPEHRNQTRNIYSWAIAPDGTQLMQTPTGWLLMAEPMQAAKTVAVPAAGPVTLPITQDLDLSALVGTLVYVGMGSSWGEVRDLNMAGHYYTVQ